MSTTTPVTSTSAAAKPPAATQSVADTLGKDDFLKLFVAQLQNQDPMNPLADSDFMGQMAQFSTLEQTTNIATATNQMASGLGVSQSLALLGRTVTYTDADKATHTGIVEKVVSGDGATTLTVGGVSGIDPSAVTEVTTS